MTSSLLTISHKWTPTCHSWIAVDTLDFFKKLLSKWTKVSQCIQTIKAVPLFLNFCAWSAVSKEDLFLQRTREKNKQRSSRSISLRDTLLLQNHGKFPLETTLLQVWQEDVNTSESLTQPPT